MRAARAGEAAVPDERVRAEASAPAPPSGEGAGREPLRPLRLTEKLEVHHRVPVAVAGAAANRLELLETLCRRCHHAEHRRISS